MCAKINAKLKSVEEECESLRRVLSVEIDGRKEVEGETMRCYRFTLAFGIVFYRNLLP